MEQRVIGVNTRKVEFYKISERVNGIIKKNEYYAGQLGTVERQRHYIFRTTLRSLEEYNIW